MQGRQWAVTVDSIRLSSASTSFAKQIDGNQRYAERGLQFDGDVEIGRESAREQESRAAN